MVLVMAWAMNAAADSTFVYAVQLSAQVQTQPPQINLNWQPDPYGVDHYTIFRKAKDSADWGAGTWLPGSATSFADQNVVAGEAYEYQVIKSASLGYTGYGYIYAGIEVPTAEARGKLVLVVATESASGLDNELARLQSDLAGDGWQVLREDVSTGDSPESVRGRIMNHYYADPANVRAVFLLGHVPILLSGQIEYDSHGARAMPADGYYGEMNNDWPTDPNISPGFLPSDVVLMVGRVDFADMPGVGASLPWPSEQELVRNYLNKDHRWRHKQISVQRRALMANRVGDYQAQAPAASGYRNFEPLVGPGNTVEANVQDAAPPDQRWISMVSSDAYLWTYGCGGGQPSAISELGDHGLYNDVWSTDIVGRDAKAVFTMMFGSSLGDWEKEDNIMRSILATPTTGLTCCMAGRPHWFFHHMGLGEPIGYSARLTMNNSTLYMNQSNYFTRAVYIGLLGDPTLRLDPVAPPAGLTGGFGNGGTLLNWSPSPDAVRGYYVYRSNSPAGPFTRLTPWLIPETSFLDLAPPSGTSIYMVRAVTLQMTPSGTYYNPSQGIFTTVQADGTPLPPITLSAGRNGASLTLTWNAQPGATYRVLASDQLNPPGWVDVSGTLIAPASACSWTDPEVHSRRFYLISSP